MLVNDRQVVVLEVVRMQAKIGGHIDGVCGMRVLQGRAVFTRIDRSFVTDDSYL